jgi:integrase
MAVYATCSECSARRERCSQPSAHKRFVVWTADVHLGRSGPRLRKTFQTKELADIQERQWHTDHERGELLPSNKTVSKPFDAVADEWLADVSTKSVIKNPARSEKYRVAMFKQVFGQCPIASLVFKDGNDWLADRLKGGIKVCPPLYKRERILPPASIGTCNRDLKTLKWIMAYAARQGYIKDPPFLSIKELKGANVRVRWMTEPELGLLVDKAAEIGDRDLIDVIEVGINTGFRKGNLESLVARDVSNVITAVKTKSGKPYDVPIAPALVPTLRRLIAAHPTGPLLNTTKFDKRFRKVARMAGLYAEKGDPNNVTIHTLRHTFAALYLRRGGDIYKLSKLLGHSSITITEKVYAHLCPTVMAAQAPLISTAIQRPPLVGVEPTLADRESAVLGH